MYAAPGNVGISRIAETVDIPVDDLVSLRDYAADNEIDLTVVGPESPLIGGISEAFWEAGLKSSVPRGPQPASRARRSSPRSSCATLAFRRPASRRSTARRPH